jgi:DNA-binding TFAR19-related protein (PDSD5 family)
LSGYSRLSAIKSLVGAGKIKASLSSEDGKLILDSTGAQRENAIALLANNFKTRLDGKESVVVLGDTQSYARLGSIKSLVNANRFKSDLPADEAKLILDGTGNQRESAIGLLATGFAANLGSKEITTILGDSTSYARLGAIRAIVNAGKIKANVDPADLPPILQNMDQQKTDALKILAPSLKH